MTNELLIPLLLTSLPVVHHPDRFSPDRERAKLARAVTVAWFTEIWGGLPGYTPRVDPEEQAVEEAVLQLADAIERHPDLQPYVRPRR